MHHHPIPNWGLAAWLALKTGVLRNLWDRLHLPWDAGMFPPFSPTICRHFSCSSLSFVARTDPLRLQKKLSDTCDVCFTFVFMSTGNCKEFYSIFKAHFSVSVLTVLEYDSKEVLTQKTSLVPRTFQPLLFDSWSISFSSHVNSIMFIKQRLVPDLASVLLWLLSDMVDIDPFLAHQATD